MKVRYRIIVFCLCILMSCGVLSCNAYSVLDLDYDDGMVQVRDENGQEFGSVYEQGHVFNYKVILSYRVAHYEDWYEAVEPALSDVITVYDARTSEETVLATGNGDQVSWTATESGFYRVRITVERWDKVWECFEVYQIGEPWDLQYASIEYNGVALRGGESVIYNNTSIKDALRVYFYPADEYLKEGQDYNCVITNPKNAGKCVITIVGIGKCEGTVETTLWVVSPSAKFKDVNQKGWYVGAVNYAIFAGWFNGTGKDTFEPNAPMQRGMFVTVIGRFLGIDPTESAPWHGFVDVAPQQYYAPYVGWCYGLGVVQGMDSTHFAPEQNINREQLCTMIERLNPIMSRAMEKLPEVDEDVILRMKRSGAKFADHDQISEWARSAVYGCRGEKIVNGKPNNRFDPKGNATRAEVATMMLGYVDYINRSMEYYFID